MKTRVIFQYYLFKKSHIPQSFELKLKDEYELQIIQPHNNIHDILWTFLSVGKFREYRILYNSKIIAFAQVIPKLFYFTYMDKNGYFIGPCWTDPDFRGQGLYPYLIGKIIDDYETIASDLYGSIITDNVSSQRGVAKVGAEVFAWGYKKFGMYKIESYSKAEKDSPGP